MATLGVPLTGAAAARLYDDHVVAVHALIARRVGTTIAPAVTAEAFELALRTWDQFDTNGGTERLFLFGAATTVLRDHAQAERDHLRSLRVPAGRTIQQIDDPLVSANDGRSHRARVVDHAANRDLRGSEDDPTPVIAPRDDSHEGRVMRAVAALDPDDRDILLLSLWEACSQNAIAEALSLNVSTVRSSLGRIRRELKLASAESP